MHWVWRMSRSGLGRKINSQGGGHTLALGGLRQLCLHRLCGRGMTVSFTLVKS